MLFQSIVATALLVASVTANDSELFSPRSAAGQRLLSKARRLNGDDDAYMNYGWAKDYSIKFHSCHTVNSFRAGEEGGQEEGQDPTETQRLVRFRLCPSDTCGVSCNGGGDYLVDLKEFVATYIEARAAAQENACENVQNYCDCENANDDDACLNQCYYAAGLEGCIENENGEQQEDNMEELLECQNIQGENDDYNTLYAGPYCSGTGKGIYLGAFKDRGCTEMADAGSYYKATGMTLPYQTTSMVSSTCISCKEAQENDGNNNNNGDDAQDADEVNEYCEQLYERSAKCEKKVSTSVNLYPKNGGCDYIFKTLPRLERVGGSGPSWTRILMWTFLVSTIAAGAYAYFLWSKLRRKRGIDLNGDRDYRGDSHHHQGKRGKILC
mmetsp:Transcript_52833/g.78942  ORF Transcript_52833/g.78942 Transcript_52833/m.78942 type:complete len:383 (-) Transcript_52833:159-1307(-)|eukprot:CAMPEP_0194046614 /NCGR_PEP_ID=MMETSP0009_2-20130614/21921_1 /TAXON_ID=210454 /ORGANISM="Grammatophora oceanica, Strain CCMP 410" /LENGTH=382 /DNA_ID=CAMNT_0038691981 /DNA_START=42 /DNA_END=1190 /DNA_ORIENTATION=-